MQYRTHEDGPLTTITVEKGAVRVSMLFDSPLCHVRLHTHAFDHWMIVKRGSVRIQIGQRASIKHEGERYLVKAHEHHSVLALTENAEVDCLHEHADIDPANIQSGAIPAEWLDRLVDVKRGEHAGS